MKKENKTIVKRKGKLLPMNLQLFADDKPAEPQVQQPQAQPQGQNELLSAIQGLKSEIGNMTKPQPTAEQVQAQQEQLLEEFNSNPGAVLNRFQQKAQEQAMQKVNPLISELNEKLAGVTWKDAVRTFAGQNPNAKAYSTQMNEILKTNPMMAKMAKENPQEALKGALALAMTQAIAPNGNVVEGITGNEELLNQILSNPDVKQKVVNEYLAGLNGGGAPAVPPIAGNGNAAPTVAPTPTEKPKTIKEAGQAAMAYFNSKNQANMQ